MGYFDNKIRNPKVLRILFKMSVFSVLSCFLALFVGALTGESATIVEDDKGFRTTVNLKKDQDASIKALQNHREVKLGKNDVASFAENGNMRTCYIKRAIPIYLKCGNFEGYISAKPEASVAAVLKGAGCELGDYDELIVKKPGVEEKTEREGGLNRDVLIEKGMALEVQKVSFNTRTEEHEIGYVVKEKQDPNMEEGKTRVEVEGEKGIVRLELQEKIVDGAVAEVKQMGDGEILKQPKDEVVVKGTKKPVKPEVKVEGVKSKKNLSAASAAGAAGAVQVENSGSSRTLRGIATAYNIGNRTSTGAVPRDNFTIAGDPTQIPYGSDVTVTDLRGNHILRGKMQDYCPLSVRDASKGKLRIDIRHKNPRAFGVKAVNVKIDPPTNPPAAANKSRKPSAQAAVASKPRRKKR